MRTMKILYAESTFVYATPNCHGTKGKKKFEAIELYSAPCLSALFKVGIRMVS